MAPIRHVLVALDLSDHSRVTLSKAIRIAVSCGARLTALHAVKTGTPDVTERYDRLAEIVGAEGCDALDARVIVAPGDAARTTVDFATANAADLIVLGRRRRGAFQRLFFESVGEVVTRDAPCSVLAVTEHVSSRRPRILCAIDLSESSAATLDVAASLARETRTPLTLLHVIENWNWPEVPAQGDNELIALRDRMERSAHDRLAKLLSALGPPRIHVDFLVAFGVPTLEIVRAAVAVDADMLVLGAHSKRLLGHTLLGSTSRYVLGDPPCAIVLARARNDSHRPTLAVVRAAGG
jgi:universal stress protein E